LRGIFEEVGRVFEAIFDAMQIRESICGLIADAERLHRSVEDRAGAAHSAG